MSWGWAMPEVRVVKAATWTAAKPIERADWSIGIEATGRSENPIIARVQAELGRNPWYLDRKERQDIGRRIRNAYSAALSRAMGDALRTEKSAKAESPEAFGAELYKVGERVLRALVANVKAQVNKGGRPFAELTTAYAKRKKAEFGFVKPILKATGDLLGGLRVRVDRLK